MVQPRCENANQIKRMPTRSYGHLISAIRHLRLKLRRRTMWIDAICINQLDPEERTSQVNQMREIYSQAIMTVIWLGDGNLVSKVGFEFLRATPVLAEPVENLRGLFSACNDRRREHTQYTTILCGILSDQKMGTFFLCALFTGILFRPWWARVWTLREVAVSKKLIMKCGNDEFSWDRFVEIASMLVLGSDPSASPSPGMRWLESFLSGVEGPLQKVISGPMLSASMSIHPERKPSEI